MKETWAALRASLELDEHLCKLQTSGTGPTWTYVGSLGLSVVRFANARVGGTVLGKRESPPSDGVFTLSV